MIQTVRRFFANGSGATSIEYTMIAVGIAFVVAAVTSIGSSVKGKITAASTGLN